MRLKIKIVGGLLGDTRKNRPGNLPAVIQFRRAGMRIVENNESHKLGMICREIAKKRNDILSVVVSALRINFLCRACFSGNCKTGHSSCRGGSLIADNPTQGVPNLFGSFRRSEERRVGKECRSRGVP